MLKNVKLWMGDRLVEGHAKKVASGEAQEASRRPKPPRERGKAA